MGVAWGLVKLWCACGVLTRAIQARPGTARACICKCFQLIPFLEERFEGAVKFDLIFTLLGAHARLMRHACMF